MDTWSFAIQANDDGVMSSVAVVLALLLRVVSDSLQLVPHGLGICQTLLQERQLKSLARNLSSEKGKGFIISPTLRLLREAVCLDGGAYAKRIVRAKAYTFAYLSRNLELGHSGEGQEDAWKSSVRTHAVRFFLSCLKYLHSEGRKELLLQKELFSHLTFSIKSDPDYLILEILDALKSHVLMDNRIPREVKSRSFNIKTLLRFLALYTHTGHSAGADENDSIGERAHEFLKYVCTTPGASVLYPYKGLYPKESSEERFSHPTKWWSENRDGDDHDGRYDKSVSVYNFILSEFAEKLRPWSSLKHSELLVVMFTAAPELISNYFYRNRSFTFEPKLSMTWIGYAAFLFDTISLPLPASFGDPVRFADSPPPTAVLLDNILPPPINQKVLVRCLSLKSHLTSFFATRILVAALEKLAVALRMHKSTSSRNRGRKWSEAARRLVDAFCQRIPDMKEVVRCYKSIPAENSLHKTLAGRLLRLYYEVIPQVALAANFDVSPLFVHVLKDLHQNEYEPGIKALSIMELESLVSIASYSPGMRWFSKIEGLGGDTSFSAFTALVHLLCCGDRDTPHRHLNEVLADVAVENQLVSGAAGLRPLLGALRCVVDQFGSEDIGAIWRFLDSCISRCAASPIKYLDQMESRMAEMKLESADRLSSLLTLALVEQLPYATSSGGEKSVGRITRFLSLYFNACYAWEGRHLLLETLHRDVGLHLTSSKAKLTCLGDDEDVEKLEAAEPSLDGDEGAGRAVHRDHSGVGESSLREMLHVPLLDGDDTATLTKWNSKSAEDLVDDGWVVGLARLLLSEHTNIRKEALTSILKVAARIKDSAREENTQIWLLLSELAESSKAQVESGPVPSAFVAFTMHALEVLRSPLHPLFRKVNSFLTRSPAWPLEKLPLAHDILHGEPSEDDRYGSELAWLLGYLLDSLRTAFDLSVFHKKKWFEKILALSSNPYLRSGLRTKILKIVYRATCIESGSTTLITRFGVLGWLDAQRASGGPTGDAATYEGLMRRVWETCDQDRVTTWSNGGIERLVGRRAASP